MMKVWDAYGRVGEIPREEWRTKVLPVNFQNAWNNADQLSSLINNALNDGFVPDCLEPARQLHRIDSNAQRGTTYLAVILIQLKAFDEAEKVITSTLQKHGDDGVLLTNLAKAQSGKGDEALAERTLWRALEIDPNLDNGLMWYSAIHRERGGENAGQEAFRRVAALPGSWRAQLWLARAALGARQPDQALALYRESLSKVGKPVPTDLLQQISGDLGNAGYLPEILQIVAPHFDPAAHGIQVGNNLIKANLDLGQFAAARRVLDQLYAQKRPDWEQLLSYWDTELTKARISLGTNEDKPPQVSLLTIAGPIWLKPESPAAKLFPTKSEESIVIGFLGCTSEIATNSKRIQHQMSDTPGRLSRAIPLFLAEQIQFGNTARPQTFIPWISGETPGFVLSGGAWSDEEAANHTRQGEIKCDYVVTIHLKPIPEPWTAELRLIRTIDAKCLGTLSGSFLSAKPEERIPALAQQLLSLLGEQAEVESVPCAPLYHFPPGPHFAYYLLRLEQLLAVRCGSMDGVSATFLSGEREIIGGNLQLCLDLPQNAAVRILLAQTLLAMKKARPEVISEFKDKVALLQKEYPLSEPAHATVQQIIGEAFTV